MSNVVYLSREAILSVDDVETRDVDVPQWGGTVRVRSISALERERLMKSSMIVEGRGKNTVQKFDMPTFRVKLAALAMVDGNGNRLFSERDVELLGQRNAKALETVSDVAAELAGIQNDLDEEESEGEDGEVETELGKGSEPTHYSA